MVLVAANVAVPEAPQKLIPVELPVELR